MLTKDVVLIETTESGISLWDTTHSAILVEIDRVLLAKMAEQWNSEQPTPLSAYSS